ncbi:MAG: bifunctional acetate--CoA ligase family protein/GNAT family N-acetyltransferase [Devosia sp.]
MTIRNLDALLDPGSVALIGASDRDGSVGKVVVDRLTTAGFSGPIHLVNPKHKTIAGRPAVPSVEELDQAPDLAVIATPPATIPGIITQLGRKGTRAAVVITAGLDQAQKIAMLEAARPTLMRILGPNCLGLQVPPIGLDASFSHLTARPGNLALLSQSGAIVTAMIDWAEERGIGFSVVASLGEMADVDTGDLLDHLAGDPKTHAILMYLEQVTDARKFLSAGRLAARAKPVIVVKAGRSETASRAAASHTGALAGVDAVYDAAFARAGLLRVDNLSDLFGAAQTLARLTPLASDRLAILTNGGGAGVLAVDSLAQTDATLGTLSDKTLAALGEVLPANWSKANPIDIIGDAGPERYEAALDILFADDGLDAILVMNCPTGLASSKEAAKAVVSRVSAWHNRKKPLLAAWLGGVAAAEGAELFEDAAIPTFTNPSEAVAAFNHLVRHRKAQSQSTRVPPAEAEGFAPDRERVRALIQGAVEEGRTLLTEVEAKAVLTAYGIMTVPSQVARTPHKAADIARQFLRGPHAADGVAVKILSPHITHKSDVGGVRLNLASPHEVRQASNAMMEEATRLRPDARIDGVVVQPMIRRRDAHELILGLADDPIFGPVILFGAGGTAVEVVSDKALGLPPLDRMLAADLIHATRIGALLRGYRDKPAVDFHALEGALVRLSYLASDFPQIHELDINPLLSDPSGAIALDARVRVVSAPSVAPGGNPRFAIRPYPSSLATSAEISGGTIDIRPIKPQDEVLYPAFLARITAADVRRRFFGAFSNFDHDQITRFTQIDYARAMAFVALDPADGALLGVSRLHADPDGQRAEFAILVRSDRQGAGIGRALLTTLVDYARGEGLSVLEGPVLADNTAMLRLCGSVGFVSKPDLEDPGVTVLTLKL